MVIALSLICSSAGAKCRHVLFTVKNVVCFPDIFFTEQNGEVFKAFFNFLLSFSPQTGNILSFPPSFRLKIDRKQMTFFTKDSAENLEFSNQCKPKKSGSNLQPC
jgi:hypothetical protein